MNRISIAVEPRCWRRDSLVEALRADGVQVSPARDASALVWADPQAADKLSGFLHDGLNWVQLPYAGVGPFVEYLDQKRIWTCGKGVYARPVAEAALAMLLGGFRNLVSYGRATEWSPPVGQNLDGARVLILGGGGIATELVNLLAPFDTETVILRRSNVAVSGATRTSTLTSLASELPEADAVILALALTAQTRGLIGERELALMKPTAWLINVARGAHVQTESLLRALETNGIGGAALDVTEPEPLPGGHPLWHQPNCLITPHIANTPEMGLALLARRVVENARRYRQGQSLLGIVNVAAGY